jgi:HPt (histidine-containing phosphotransfer) domain-containing protein
MHSDALESSLLAIFADEALTHLALIDAGVDALAHAATPAPLAPMLYALHTLAGAARSVGLAELGWLCGALEGVFKAAAGAGFDAMQRDRLRHAVAVARQHTIRVAGRGRNQAMALIAQLDAMALQFPPIPHE